MSIVHRVIVNPTVTRIIKFSAEPEHQESNRTKATARRHFQQHRVQSLHFSCCLGMGEGWEDGWIYKGAQRRFWEWWRCSLSWLRDSFTGVDICAKPHPFVYSKYVQFIVCQLTYVSYTSIKFNKQQNKAVFKKLKRYNQHPNSVCSSTCHTVSRK